MRCPQCGHENDKGTKFCGECGARLAARCASCGASNPPSNKLCGECGASLAQEVGVQRFASPERYTPKHLAEKILTSKSALEGELEFVTAARALGGTDRLVVTRHILPNSLPPLIVQTTLAIAFAILQAAALGFLGLGAQPPTLEWGAMLADSYKDFTSGAWWVFFFPGAAIMLSVLGFNLRGDGLRDALDPRLRSD